jgi:diguanylate cyclase (GGDEF)-like protein
MFFFACILGVGMYISIIFRPEYDAVNFFIFLICAQVLFVFDPLWNLLLNAAAVSVFAVLSVSVKNAVLWQTGIINALIAAFLGMALSWYLSYTIIKEMIATRRLESERNRFREESIRDELTGLSNRRDYLNAVNFYISVCRHVHQTVCAIMMDVDYFKNYNDFYGHQKGDIVLKSIGEVLRRIIVEEHAFAARVGGEEFIVLWTENRMAEVQRVAVKLRQMIIDLQIPHEKSTVAPYVTASFGMYILRGGASDTAEELYNYADKALYEAKKNGRNCIMCMNSEDRVLKRVEILPPEKNIGRR